MAGTLILSGPAGFLSYNGAGKLRTFLTGKDYRSVTGWAAKRLDERNARLATSLLLWALSAPLACLVMVAVQQVSGGALVAAALLTPPLLTLGLRPWWDRPLGRILAVLAWLAAGLAAVAASGGIASPAVPFLLVGPALVRAWTGRAWWTLALVSLLAAPVLALGVGTSGLPGSAAAVLGLSGLALALGLAAIGARFAGPVAPSERQAAGPQGPQLSALAHELRTPLHQILGFAEVIEERLFGDAPERYAEYAGLIRSSGGHLLELSDAWLEQARLQAGARALELERFDLAGLTQEVVRSFERQLQAKQLTLSWQAFRAPFWVDADRRAWRQVLTNLIGNAVKFTPEGGRVGIGLVETRAMVRLSIEDSGPGVPAAERRRLARPFVRGAAGAQAEGAGLGLSIVKGLLELHGGRLEIGASALGGARFTAAAPLKVSADADLAPQSA